MISVKEATDIIQEHTLALSTEKVAIDQCTGRVLQEDLIADRDFPPYDRVTMDGIAIAYDSWDQGQRKFAVQETAAAGAPQVKLKDPKSCIEVMTGAILPSGCDTVIRYEDLKLTKKSAEIVADEITKGQNVHMQGSDRQSGALIVRRGHPLTAAEIGIAATIGKSKLEVNGRPKIAVVSTGDELVDIDKTPKPHQIRQSNVHQIHAMIEPWCSEVKNFHIPDDEKKVEGSLKKILSGYDAVILSGGVSAGKYDYVPAVLEKLGVEKLFYKVAQRPGKPFWFGVMKSAGGSGAIADPQTADWQLKTAVFALPGNPVSSFMCTLRYIIPWLEKSSGVMHRNTFAIPEEDVTFRPALTYFLQVQLDHKSDGRLYATPVAGHGSGDLANLVEADAFLELPEAGHVYHAGGSFPVWRWR